MGTFTTIGTFVTGSGNGKAYLDGSPITYGVLDFEPQPDAKPFGNRIDPHKLVMPASAFTFEGVIDENVLPKYFGADMYETQMEREHSVVLEWEKDVPCPQPPDHAPGFWAWLRGTNGVAMAEYWERHDDWVLNCGKVKMQIFIPVANVQVWQ